jgi:hypothetical protein
MRKFVLSAIVGTAMTLAATAASATVTLGNKGSSCSTIGCTAGTASATVTQNVTIPNSVEFDDTNASAGTQTAWFNFYVTPAMLGTFSATVATYPVGSVTMLELLTGSSDGTNPGSTLVTSTSGTQLTWENLTSGTWYTFEYTANLPTAGDISGTGNFYPAVPEPATWALMLLGFGGIGFAMRRQRRNTVLAQVA